MEKSLPSTTTNAVYIAFHLKNSLNAPADAARLGVLLERTFGVEQIETVDLDTQDKEVVYKVTTPLLASTEEGLLFFESLKTLFEKTDEYHPHFTQIYG